MQHQRAGNQVRKDQSRRLKYQEQQRIQQKVINAPNADRTWGWNQELNQGQLKSFASKLIK